MAEMKILGKIDSAEFGRIRDYPFLMGLILNFKFKDGGVGDGGRYTVNMGKECKWETPSERRILIEERMDFIYNLLNEAKCNNVSQLKGKPVEVTLIDNCFHDFRILTEVL